jgi:hypothetical protein
MARQIGSGGRCSVSGRVATIVGIVCAAVLAFAGPALADEDGGNGSDGGSSHSGSANEDHANSDNNGDSDNDGDSANNGDNDNDGDENDDHGDSDPNLVKGTTCTKTARACVDLKSQKAWLIDPNGDVTRGPVPVSSGGPGEETPVGTFSVRWKDKNHKSQEYKAPNGQPAPMPYSVFFTSGGVAFHGGSLSRASAGCVHLADPDAIAFYNTLKLGDQVQVH